VVPPVDLGGVVAGQQRLGTGLVGLITTLREAGRWPVATVQWSRRTVHRLPLSVGAIGHRGRQAPRGGGRAGDRGGDARADSGSPGGAGG
jgi:hypothetical protein